MYRHMSTAWKKKTTIQAVLTYRNRSVVRAYYNSGMIQTRTKYTAKYKQLTDYEYQVNTRVGAVSVYLYVICVCVLYMYYICMISHSEVCPEVVGHLCQDPCPVDRVHGA